MTHHVLIIIAVTLALMWGSHALVKKNNSQPEKGFYFLIFLAGLIGGGLVSASYFVIWSLFF